MQLSAADVDQALVASARITYVEGYLVGPAQRRRGADAADEAAHRAGRRVALTLSDPFWVGLQHDAFKALLPSVDILLGNETEALEMTGEADLEAARRVLAKTCRWSPSPGARPGRSPPMGTRRSASRRSRWPRWWTPPAPEISSPPGSCSGWPGSGRSEDCLRLGALAAAEVISHIGARPQTSLAALAAARGLAV